MNRIGQVVIVGCGEDLFAVPVDRVQEILDLCPISRLPHAPAHLLGVIDVRGDDVSVADLRCLLGFGPIADTEATRIVVMWLQNADRRAVIAVKADRVIEVTKLDDECVSAVPEAALFHWDERLVAGIGRSQGRFVTVLDLDYLSQSLATPDRREVA